MSEEPAKVAFLILSDDPARAMPGLVMASRLKENRGDDVRVMFFGPGVRLAASGKIDEQIKKLQEVGVLPKACRANVEQYEVQQEMAERPIELLAAGAEVEEYAKLGYTVLSF
ncbi:hypothetical protein SAMN02745225_01725 [Ferrithrix thermotolerans DSM 19514]|uniref:Uncharacterized protein n=1 Tax=Ferrithrix thermotolerans DSM 19514 TaxID=1121881 RepID=A0A1M4WN94_9ACTN|nr:DsrE family protein [Ferrithrix thermotolerans]SHE82630.1 hypothetical protein SAMN02745225_01725 [Ferrithrix thermotolerans DSM 19514]